MRSSTFVVVSGRQLRLRAKSKRNTTVDLFTMAVAPGKEASATLSGESRTLHFDNSLSSG